MTNHHPDCEDATGAYPGRCTCAVIKHPPADMAGLDGLIERLREPADWAIERPLVELRTEAATQLQALAARMKVLEAENALLAAGACINPGQHGLVGDEHGNSYCTAFRALQDEEREHSEALAQVARLEARLEIDPAHPYDGIYARDETIRGLDARVKVLEAENERLRGALIEIRDCTGEHGGAAKALKLISAALGVEAMTKHTDTSRSGDLVKMLRAGDLCGLTLAADRIEALVAEVERLRAVLFSIEDQTDTDPETMWIADIICAALKGVDPKDT